MQCVAWNNKWIMCWFIGYENEKVKVKLSGFYTIKCYLVDAVWPIIKLQYDHTIVRQHQYLSMCLDELPHHPTIDNSDALLLSMDFMGDAYEFHIDEHNNFVNCHIDIFVNGIHKYLIPINYCRKDKLLPLLFRSDEIRTFLLTLKNTKKYTIYNDDDILEDGVQFKHKSKTFFYEFWKGEKLFVTGLKPWKKVQHIITLHDLTSFLD